MSTSRWSDWYQPADVTWTLSTDPGGGSIRSTTEQAVAGDVRFGLDLSTMSAFRDAVVNGENWAVGSGSNCWTDDYENQAPGYTPVTGWAIPGTGFYMYWSGGLGIEQDANVKRQMIVWQRQNAWTYAASHAIFDPALPWNDSSLVPPGAYIDDWEFETRLYADDQYSAAAAVASATMDTVFDQSWANTDGSYQVHAYDPSIVLGLGDYAMWHPHGSVVENKLFRASPAPPVTNTFPIPDLPAGMVTVPSETGLDWDTTPLRRYNFTPMQPSVLLGGPLPSLGQTIAMGGDWGITEITITLTPARVRFLWTFDIEPPLRLFQRDDAQGLIRSARLGGHTDVGNGPSSLQEQQAPRLPQTGNTYR